jgi:cytochrome c-type biogenesis protein CcmH
MITFVILAAALTLAAAAAIAVPLLRRDPGMAQAPWTAFGVMALLAVGATSLYVSRSNWSWSKAAVAESPSETVVSTLARRVWHHPDDLQGWLMLGRSYMDLQQTPLAVRAFEHANQIAGGRNADVLLSLAEALSVEDETQLNGRAGRLVEQALVLEPHSAEALFFGAAAALHRGDLPLARTRLVAMLALDPPPPDSVKPVIEQEIAAIDQRLAGGGSGAGQVAAGGPAGADSATPGGEAGDRTAPSAAVRVHVALSPKLRSERTQGAPLFVFVRDPKQPGPPLAVKRLETRFPQTVELTSADAMISGHGIVPGEDVEVVARISRSGSPIAQKGDPFGEVAYHIGRDGIVDVVIDRLTP